MNKEGKFNSSKSVKPSNNLNKKIAGVLIGGVVLGSIWYAYRRFKKSNINSQNNDAKDAKIDENTSVNDNEEKIINYSLESDFIGELSKLIIDDSMYGKDDVIIVKEESDEDKIDDRYGQYALVEYVESSSSSDGYLSITLKFNDELKGKLRGTANKDPQFSKIKYAINELKDSQNIYRSIGVSSKALSFYFDLEDGRHGEDLKYSELINLESISGFRYVEFRFYHCESSVGVNFIKKVLDLFHPEYGEEEMSMNYMPVVLSYTCGGIDILEDNKVLNKYIGY